MANIMQSAVAYRKSLSNLFPGTSGSSSPTKPTTSTTSITENLNNNNSTSSQIETPVNNSNNEAVKEPVAQVLDEIIPDSIELPVEPVIEPVKEVEKDEIEKEDIEMNNLILEKEKEVQVQVEEDKVMEVEEEGLVLPDILVPDFNIDPALLSTNMDASQPEPLLNQNEVPLFASASTSEVDLDELASELQDLSDLSELDTDAEEEVEKEGAVASTSANKLPDKTSVKRKSKPRASTSTSTPVKGNGNINNQGFSTIPLPHYTIKRTKPNSKENPHVITVKAGVTDAHSSRWPTVTKKNAGAPNWYECGEGAATRVNNWKEGLGRELAERLGENTGKNGKNEFFILEEFPEGNKFFVHHSSSSKGNGLDRLDSYLFGSRACAKFRTVNEYAPHLYWLLSSGPGAALQCQCKYCTGKKQTEVNKILGLNTTLKREVSRSPVVEKVLERDRPAKRARTSINSSATSPSLPSTSAAIIPVKPVVNVPVKAVVKKATPPVIPVAASTSKANPRVSDTKRRNLDPKAPEFKPSAPSYNGAYSDPQKELDLKEKALHRVGEMVWIILPKPYLDAKGNRPELISHWPALATERKIATQSKRIGTLEAGKIPLINNAKSFQYIVRLLACCDEFTVPESSLIAWLGHPQPMDLWSNQSLLTAAESVKLVWNGEACLRPKLGAKRTVFEVMAPFALAMQIAAHIVSSFCLVDRYMLKPAHIESLTDLDEDEEKASTAHLSYCHYQSLWTGSERIYSGELVRLLLTPAELPIDSYELCPGAETRAFFLEIVGLYKDSDKSKAMCCGTVYQLKDIRNETAVEGGMKMFETGSASSTPPISAVKEGKRPERSNSAKRILSNNLITSLPDPPPGFAFVKLMKLDVQSHFDIESVASRYRELPIELANSPAKVEEISLKELEKDSKLAAGSNEPFDEAYTPEVRSLILAGLLPAVKLFMKTHSWAASRTLAVTHAETMAQGEMSSFFKQRQINMALN